MPCCVRDSFEQSLRAGAKCYFFYGWQDRLKLLVARERTSEILDMDNKLNAPAFQVSWTTEGVMVGNKAVYPVDLSSRPVKY